MALTSALHGALLRGARGKVDTCMGTILLESSSVKTYGKIVGKFILRTDTELKHFGIRVQFEAVCNLQFETKFDSRVTFHKKQLSILAKSMDTDSEGYQLSPVMVELVESRPTISENQMQTWSVILAEQPAPNLPPARPHIMQPGIHNFGFELIIPGEILPAPFRSPYGTLVYKVVAYIKNELAAFVQIADKSVRYPGYHNLALNEEAAKAINLERTLKKSVFSSKKFVTAAFKVEKSGYLPDEDIPFTLSVNNPKCMTMSTIVVSLIQKINYQVNGANKATTNTLDTKEYPLKDPKPEIDWHGKMKIKRRQIHTYTDHQVYTVTHVILYKVQVTDYGSLKGEAPIFIGTTRDTVEQLTKTANTPDEHEPKVPKSLKIKRQGSSASTTSAVSATEGPVKSPPFSPSDEQLPTVCDDDQVEESAKKLEEMQMSPGEEVSTSSV
ncbi:unnamed protein product [Orchesella dallaii]|uniref:Arrestin C-terminal-like domain-containing protein n=1 Tax=Orchesella dallaii TaxID=48710 RepID=A0ABP1QY20_9HEXA